MNKKLEKWLRWFDVLKVEVRDLVIAKHVFNEVQSIIRANPQLHQPSSFYDYLARTYVSHVLIGLRRQLKIDSQSVSFTRLLSEMIDNPEAYPRNHFTDKYKGSVVAFMADRDFDKFAGKGAPHIDPRLVEADLSNLRTASRRCEDFADRRVAHRDLRAIEELPTFGEVDGCVDLLDKLYVKYFLLFHASSMDTVLPTWQYDWQSIFRVRWIDPSADDEE